MSVDCEDCDGYDEGQPQAGFDTLTGYGTGRLNLQSGEKVAAEVYFTFTDAGEPGQLADRASYLIKADLDGDGSYETTVLDCQGDQPPGEEFCLPGGRLGELLDSGNHQAHRLTGNSSR